MDSHARREIREYGRAMVVKEVSPLAYESFERRMFNEARFSSDEIDAFEQITAGKPTQMEGWWLEVFEGKLYQQSRGGSGI